MTTTMRSLVVLGAGTAGTMVVNKLRHRLPTTEWRITVVDKDDVHDYQPGYLFLPFGLIEPEQVRRSRHGLITEGVELVLGDVDRVDPAAREVSLLDGRTLATTSSSSPPARRRGPTRPRGCSGPSGTAASASSTPTRVRWPCARRSPASRAAGWSCTSPRCRSSARWRRSSSRSSPTTYLRRRGLRERTEIVYVTPLDGAFTKPVASRELGHLLADKGITVETDFMVEHVDQERRVLVSYDEREVAYDQLVTIPLNMGADFVARSGLGDELNYVPVDKHTSSRPSTRRSSSSATRATSRPRRPAPSRTSPSRSSSRTSSSTSHGQAMTHSFDGHANCFVESGGGKAMLLDFNYDTEPLTGTFPLPRLGPMTLLKQSRANHLGKLAFRHIYWNILLPGRPLGLPAQMSMAGKVPAA